MKSATLPVLFVIALMSVSAAWAETARSGGEDAMRRAQYLIRQLSQEKSDLEARNAQLQAELDGLRTRVAKLEKDADRADHELTQSRQSNERLVERVQSDHERAQELMTRYQETARLATLQKGDMELLKNAVTERDAWIDKCKANNDALSHLNMELVDRYRDKGFWQTLTQSDPVTGLGQVKLEVIADDYRYRIEDLQVSRYQDATAAGLEPASTAR